MELWERAFAVYGGLLYAAGYDVPYPNPMNVLNRENKQSSAKGFKNTGLWLQ